MNDNFWCDMIIQMPHFSNMDAEEALVKMYAQSMYHYACQYDVREGRVYRGDSECGVGMFVHSVDGFGVAVACEQPSMSPQVLLVNCANLCCQYL